MLALQCCVPFVRMLSAQTWANAQVLPPPRQDAEEQDIDKSTIAVAIVGRPNVGKSSLVNGITGTCPL